MKQADADGLDTGLAPCRSRRGRRAAALIAMSAIAMVVAGYPYVGPAPTFAGQTGGPIPSSRMVQPLGDLISYSVVNRLLAWALVAEVSPPSDLGQFWIFVTVDGAKHWRQQFAGKSSYIALTITSFQFFDSKNGHVVAGNPLLLYRTGDGGGHWITDALPDPTASEITFGDPLHGWLLAHTRSAPAIDQIPHLYATGDGGATWSKLPDPPNDAVGLSFRGPREGWSGGGGTEQAHVYSTTDGGLNWQRHDLPSEGFPSGMLLPSRVVLLPGHGVVTFQPLDGEVEYTSFDGGNSWRGVLPRPMGVSFGGSIGFQDAVNWWAIDDGGVPYKSPNAGGMWIPLTSQQTSDESLYFLVRVLDSKTAWARIESPYGIGLGITDDSGVHWTRVTVPQPGK